MTGPGRLATLRSGRNGLAVRLDRRAAATPAGLWGWVTEPARLTRWLGETTVEPGTGPRKGTRATLSGAGGRPPGGPVDLTVRYCDPERMLEVEWRYPDGRSSEVVVEVVELSPGRSLLVIEHQGLAPGDAVEQAVAWHGRVDVLDALLSGRDPEPVEPAPGLRSAYEQVLAALLAEER